VSTLSGYSDAEIYHHVIRSRLAQIDGDLETAAQEIDRAAELMQRDAPAAVREEVIAQQVRVSLAQNRLAAAQALLSPHGFIFQPNLSMPGIKPEQFISRAFGLLTISALRVFLYQAQNGGAVADLQQGIELAGHLITAAHYSNAIPIILETLLVRAQMFAVRAADQASRADIAAALELAQPEGFISIFLEEGLPVAQILATLPTDPQPGKAQFDYVNKILAAFPQPMRSLAISAPAALPPAGPLFEPLSKRELEILRLIDEGCTNQEIAERLMITLHTVKKHSSNIYGKLGVRSRTQALSRARELRLL
jgi:LuxR family maltose regulon positive regulatory protein